MKEKKAKQLSWDTLISKSEVAITWGFWLQYLCGIFQISEF